MRFRVRIFVSQMLKEILQILTLPCYLQIALNVRNNCALNDEKGGGGKYKVLFL